jgi:hypothetical protein
LTIINQELKNDEEKSDDESEFIRKKYDTVGLITPKNKLFKNKFNLSQ